MTRLRSLFLTFIALINSQNLPFGDNSNGPEKSFINIPRKKIDVIVECKGRQINVIITKDYILNNAQWLGNGEYLSLQDYSCKAVTKKDGNLTITIDNDFTKCGNVITTEKTKNPSTDNEEISTYIISNKLIHDNANGAIQRVIDLLEFECRYAATTITSQWMQPWLKSAAHEDKVKDIVGTMRLYKDENFTSAYMKPPVLGLDEDLFIQVDLEKPLISGIDAAQTDIAVVMEQCWGTPNANRDGDVDGQGVMKYLMIDNGCPRDDPSLTILNNGESLISKFQIKMFKFIGDSLDDVWLHCTVRACNNTVPENCIPDCGNRRKRSTKRKKLWFVSGPHEITTDLPIQKKMTDEELQMELEKARGHFKVPFNQTPAFKTMLIAIAVIVALMLVFAIIYIYVQKRNAVLAKFGEGGLKTGSGDVMFGKKLQPNTNLSSSSATSTSASSIPSSEKKLPYNGLH